jgi:type IX secretion system PorP/SprF family membrane protein
MAMVNVLNAQSYHFSQFFSTPLLTNPANTGFIDGSYRISSNFRSQGMSGGSPYFTGYLSADISPLRDSLPNGHKAGIGMYVMNDRSLSGALQTNSIAMSAAYNVGLDKNGQSSFGVGLQGVYHQRRIDYTKLSFENQYGPGGYNPSLPIGEALDNRQKNYLDVNAGILYNAILTDKSFFGGVSVYNILRQEENVLGDDFKMPTRLVIQGGAQFTIKEYERLYLSLTNMYQAKAHETTLGGAYGIQFGEKIIKNEVRFGIWYRYKDALIPYIGYYYEGFQTGLSWDYTVSSLKTSSQLRNGFELTVLYRGVNKKEIKTTIPWY